MRMLTNVMSDSELFWFVIDILWIHKLHIIEIHWDLFIMLRWVSIELSCILAPFVKLRSHPLVLTDWGGDHVGISCSSRSCSFNPMLTVRSRGCPGVQGVCAAHNTREFLEASQVPRRDHPKPFQLHTIRLLYSNGSFKTNLKWLIKLYIASSHFERMLKVRNYAVDSILLLLLLQY